MEFTIEKWNETVCIRCRKSEFYDEKFVEFDDQISIKS